MHKIHIQTCTDCGKQIAYSWQPFTDTHALCKGCMQLICEMAGALELPNIPSIYDFASNCGIDSFIGVPPRERMRVLDFCCNYHIVQARKRHELKRDAECLK